MISETQPRVVTTNAGETGAFTIKANGKAFKVLIDKLYANKIQSITREIWSNALDAHIAAGCADRPFDVSFPSAFDPSFRVRDYGISLTHEQVMKLYTTLFESTKEDTNDQVGKFGLGSKSPFAYTDSFAVTVVKDGEKRFYAAMIGSDGVPTINFMGREDSDEENGVEVSFPVEREDVAQFARAAKRVSHGFAVKPNVVNDPGFEGWPEVDILMEGEGWVLSRGEIDGYRQTAYARMGCVLYPINVAALGHLTQEQRAVLEAQFIIDFKMGELEITASREELSYGRGEPTTESILAKTNEIYASLLETAMEGFEDCASYWEACTEYHNRLMSSLPEVIKMVMRQNARYGNRKLSEEYKFDTSWKIGIEACMINGKKDFSRKNQRFKYAMSVMLKATQRTVILIDDVNSDTKKVTSRVSHFVRNHCSEYAANKYNHVVWLKVYNAKAAQNTLVKLVTDLGNVDFIDVADLELPVTARSGARSPVMARVYHNGHFNTPVGLSEEDFEEGGIYVPLERMKPVSPDGYSSAENIIRILRELGALRGDVYGIPKSMMKQIDDAWTTVFDFATEYFDSLNVNIPETVARNNAIAEVRRDGLLSMCARNVDVSRLSPDSPILNAVTLYNEASAAEMVNVNKHAELARAISAKIGTDVATSELEQAHEDARSTVLQLYPMLEVVSIYGTDVDRITDYVVMCDRIRDMDQNQAALLAA